MGHPQKIHQSNLKFIKGHLPKKLTRKLRQDVGKAVNQKKSKPLLTLLPILRNSEMSRRSMWICIRRNSKPLLTMLPMLLNPEIKNSGANRLA